MKKVLLGLALGIVLMVGCSGTSTENRSYGPGKCIYTFERANGGAVYVFTYENQKYMVATNGYQGGISLIQINK